MTEERERHGSAVSSRIVSETFQWIFRRKITRFLFNALFRKTKRGKPTNKKNSKRINSRVLRLNFDLESFSSFRQKKKKSHFFEFVLLSKSNRTFVVLIVYKTKENKDNRTPSLLKSPGSIMSIVSRSQSITVVFNYRRSLWKIPRWLENGRDSRRIFVRRLRAGSGSRRLRQRTVSIIRRKARLRFGISKTPPRRELLYENYFDNPIYAITLPARTPFSLHVQLWSLTCAWLTWNSRVGRCYQSESFELSYRLLTVVATGGSLVSDVIFSFLNRRTSKCSRNGVKYFDLTIKPTNETNSSRDLSPSELSPWLLKVIDFPLEKSFVYFSCSSSLI